MKRSLFALTMLVMVATLFFSCSKKEKIMIWTSGEDYRNEMYLSRLREQFPSYDIRLEYMSSSNIAAKIIEEKENTTCDIILSEEYGYLDMCDDYIIALEGFDFSRFLDELVPQSRKYTPETKNGGAIIINKKLLDEKKLPVPKSYDDLLDSKYKGLISMPNPSTSGTGYMFLLQLSNLWGDDRAFDYFEKLSKNMLHYTTSGSGPINDLIRGEAAIAIGMTAQAVTENNNGSDFDIIFFKEGSPYSMYGNAITKKAKDRTVVREVFDYLSTTLAKANNELYFPDQIFKGFTPKIEGYPKNIKYSNMDNNTIQRKKDLQSRWSFT